MCLQFLHVYFGCKKQIHQFNLCTRQTHCEYPASTELNRLCTVAVLNPSKVSENQYVDFIYIYIYI